MTYVDSDTETLASDRTMPRAVGIDGRLQFVFDFNERHYVWAYKLAVFNPTPYEIEIRGRRWEIAWGLDRETAPPQAETERLFAPSFAGGRPILAPGSDFVFETAIVTESADPPTMSGELEFYNRTTDAKGHIDVSAFTFRRRRCKTVALKISRLDDVDTRKICVAIKAYNGLVKDGSGAVFRVDRTGLTAHGRTLVNCFLFTAFRFGMEKGRLVDFAPILHPDTKASIKLETTDHYIGRTQGCVGESKGELYFSYVVVYKYWEVLKQKPADAGLVHTMADIRVKFGFAAIEELLRIASPEERARVSGMVAAEFRTAAIENEAPKQLSGADKRAFVAHSKKRPWTGTNELSPSTFIAKNFKIWLQRGLSLKDIRNTQPKLAGAYSVEVNRDSTKRLPNLYVKPHKLPAGSAPSASRRRVSELTEEELLERRAVRAKKQQTYREAKRSDI